MNILKKSAILGGILSLAALYSFSYGTQDSAKNEADILIFAEKLQLSDIAEEKELAQWLQEEYLQNSYKCQKIAEIIHMPEWNDDKKLVLLSELKARQKRDRLWCTVQGCVIGGLYVGLFAYAIHQSIAHQHRSFWRRIGDRLS
jgi:hypothetical protein